MPSIIMDTLESFERFLDRLSRQSPFFSTKNYHYACVICGFISTLCFVLALVAADFLPPIPPYWEADRVYQHYKDHQRGIQGGAILLLFSGAFYVPYTSALSSQLRRIPNLHPIFYDTQLAAGTSCVTAFLVPSFILAVAGFRDYGPELTMLLNDFFWISTMIVWTTFWMQSWAIAWAIWADRSEKPVLPKTMALISFISPIGCTSVTGVHTTYYGPYAWNGAFGFWLTVAVYGIQIGFDMICMFRSIYHMPDEEEKEDLS